MFHSRSETIAGRLKFISFVRTATADSASTGRLICHRDYNVFFKAANSIPIRKYCILGIISGSFENINVKYIGMRLFKIKHPAEVW
jgi:hypothetical protein